MTTKTLRLLAKILFLTMIPISASAQTRQFTLEDLNYGGNNYRNMVPKNKFTTWWGDELIHLDVEECLIVDKKSGREKTLLTLENAKAWSGLKVRSLLYAQFPYADRPLVLLSDGKERALVDWKTGKATWKGSVSGSDTEEWNKASKASAFVKDNQLYVCDGSGNTRHLTTDGSRNIVYGQSVHRNEFGIEGGLFWSPDGNRLAFYRMDQSMVTDYPLVDIDTRVAEQAPEKYPMAGMASHKVTVGVYDLATGNTVYLKAGDPTDRYFTNISWSPDSKTIYMFELNRDQNDCRLVSYDASNGEKKAELYREQDDKYVEPQHPIAFLPWDCTKFVMQSQKDGYNHLYLLDANGKEVRQITKGNWVVMDMLGFNTKEKTIVYSSNQISPIQRNTFAITVDGAKTRQLDNGKGYHYASLSGKSGYVLDRYSEPDVPRAIDIAATTIKAKNKTLAYFRADNPWKDYAVPEYSCGSIKAADGTTDLFYRMVKPVNFDETKKYPTIIYVYGGPHAHNVDATWHYGSRGWETYMAQKGYLLFILDNRGSENRGKDFEQATFRHLGQEEMKDQMKGVEYLKSLPYVDEARIGVHGWSFGGFMTTSLMTNYPDVFKVGVAGGPVIDWKWYEVMYGERYMDTPESNPEGYAQTSLISKAKNLKGKLQIIIGLNDPVVVPQHALSFIKECILQGTQPDFFVYPGEPHNMRGHQSTHLHERISQYFDDYLK